MSILKNKRYVIVSNWTRPFGGGEEFLFQTMQWASQLGMKSYWIGFCNAKNEPFKEFELVVYDFGLILKIPGGFSQKKTINWLKLLRPDIVHHQGQLRKDFFECCEQNRIEFMSGYHFWWGAICLDSEKKNVDILENAKYHTTDDELKYLYDKKYCNLYTVTKFVSNCIEKVTSYKIPDNIYASSSYSKCKITNMNILKNRYVSMVNIHKLKGGEILLHLMKRCKNIPFLGVKTEYGSEDLDKEIEDAVRERNEDGEQCMIMDRVSDAKIIYQQTKILLVPSLVDETFCRVVNEAMMNGIPVLTTGAGNIKFLVGNNHLVIPFENKRKWKSVVEELYFHDDVLLKYSKEALMNYNLFSEQRAIELFERKVSNVLQKSKEMNVMIFSPWCDQGLGIQSRNYSDILKRTDYNVHIFALKPYNADSCIEMQRNPEEWRMDYIYYSPKNREEVTDIEIITFVKKYNIGKCLLPETCWFRVFEIAKLLKKINVKCYAIPNIEIVRKDEIFKHRYFHKILCNNNLCKNIFNSYGIINTEYIGYGIDNDNIKFKSKKMGEKIKFLFIGGMNAFSRKHGIEICEAFDLAYQKRKDIELTCTVQMFNLLEDVYKNKIDKFINHPGINFIQEHLTYSDIINKYYENHISIQVSKHEGLGLGFYEALNTGTPIISLDTPPHNEIIKNEVNGWIIPCHYKKMIDNKDPLFESAYFDPKVLGEKIINICENFGEYNDIIKSLIIDYNERLHLSKFTELFLNSIDS